MFRAILVPLDGSALAEYALSCAARLARHTDATLHLVRVVEPPARLLAPQAMEPAYVPGAYLDEVMSAMDEAATDYLDATAQRLTATGLCVQVAQLDGLTMPALLDYQHRARIDLVAMCSHGRSGLGRLAFGSVADRLLRHGSAPVLHVRPFGAPAAFTQALVPLDGSRHAEAALDVVAQLAHQQVLREVQLLRVIGASEEGPEAERYLAAIAQCLWRQHLSCRYQVTKGDITQSIKDQAGTEHLVVMATHGRGGPARLVRGSVADQVARGNVAAVLLVREGPTAQLNISAFPTHPEDHALARASSS